MVYCNQCSRENVEGAKFCDRCGSPIMIGQKPSQAQSPSVGAPTPPVAPPAPPVAPPPENFGERFGREMSAAGERFGREMAKAGERIGKEFEAAGKRLENRYDRTYRVFRPLIGALVCWGILVFIILGIQSAKTSPAGDPEFPQLGAYLAGNLLLFLGLLLLFGYIGYAQKRMRGYAKWVLPVTVAAGLTILSWLAAEALAALAVDQGNQALADSARFGNSFLPVIFIVILVLGYVIVFLSPPRFPKPAPLPPRLN